MDETIAVDSVGFKDEYITIWREIESAVLGAVMRGGLKTYEAAAEIIDAKNFYLHRLRWIWNAFESLKEQNLSIDTISVGDELARSEKLEECGGRVFLASLRENGIPTNIETYALKLHEQYAKRLLMRIGYETYIAAANGSLASVIYSDMMTKISRVPILTRDEHTSHISEIADEAYEWSAKTSRGEIKAIQTGIAKLDDMLGGLIPENTYIIAGRPGTGKTALMVSVAYNVAMAGGRLAFFSLEMSRVQIMQRFYAIDSGVNLNRIVTGKMTGDEWRRLRESRDKMKNLNIVINAWSGNSADDISRISKRVDAQEKIDLLVVDYVQLIENRKTAKNIFREQEVAAISRALKHLCSELKIPALIGAQLNRNSEARADKRPSKADLRESGALEQDAYGVLLLHRADDSEQTEIIVDKHRNGPTGVLKVNFQKEIARFTQC